MTFVPDHGWSLFHFVNMRDELIATFGRPVDILTRSSVEKSQNPYRRHEILTTPRTVYVAA